MHWHAASHVPPLVQYRRAHVSSTWRLRWRVAAAAAPLLALRKGCAPARLVRRPCGTLQRGRLCRRGPARAYARSVAEPETPLWHALDAHSAVARLATDPQHALASEAIDELRARFGPNALPAAQQRSIAAVFLGQFKSPLIYLLFAAAAIALALGETKDAIVIFVVVLLN